jgi:hypothetical protein
MRIDSTHWPWLIGTLTALSILTASFIVYAALSHGHARGGSLPGLAYGAAGYGLMLYAALLGLRKKVPVWRIGKAQTWMRGHLWLGFLSLPLILFHCAFTWKGPLASLLMILLFITVGSGLIGAALQHYIPKLMTRSVPMETIFEEIPHVRRQLCAEADELAAGITSSGINEGSFQVEIDPDARAHFASVYARSIRPGLASGQEKHVKPDPERLRSVFDSLRRLLPETAHPILADIEHICEEERQLQRQRRIYFWLHGWLLVHVPLSIALLVLGAVHAVMALPY